MQDMETNSLWSHVSGEAIRGQLEGKTLQLLASTMSTFEEFKRDYPQGLILDRETRGQPGSHYDSYFSDNSKLGIFGRVDNFQKIEGKEKVVGLRSGDRQFAVTVKFLQSEKFTIADKFEPPVVVTKPENDSSIYAFQIPLSERGLADLSITGGALELKESGKRWDARTGKALSEGAADLQPFPMTTAFWFAWASFFPNTELVK